MNRSTRTTAATLVASAALAATAAATAAPASADIDPLYVRRTPTVAGSKYQVSAEVIRVMWPQWWRGGGVAVHIKCKNTACAANSHDTYTVHVLYREPRSHRLRWALLTSGHVGYHHGALKGTSNTYRFAPSADGIDNLRVRVSIQSGSAKWVSPLLNASQNEWGK